MSKHSAKCKLCPVCGSTNRDVLLVRLRDQINELETALNDLRTTLESAIQLP